MKRFSSSFVVIHCLIRMGDGSLRYGAIGSFLENEAAIRLKTTLFAEKCIGDDFTVYVTPINKCYNGKEMGMLGEDSSIVNNFAATLINGKNVKLKNPYGENDILDELIKENDEIIGIKRSFFHSKNTTCTGGITDSFPNIPIDICVGPFGPPKPWGILNVINQTSEDMTLAKMF